MQLKAWRKGDLPLVKEDLVRDHLNKLNTHESMGPNGVWDTIKSAEGAGRCHC